MSDAGVEVGNGCVPAGASANVRYKDYISEASITVTATADCGLGFAAGRALPPGYSLSSATGTSC